MKNFFVVFLCFAAWQSCHSRSMPEEDSVVSIYTTEPSPEGTKPLDVYQQIATNIAERITSPIYRFLGFNNSSSTTEKPSNKTHKTWEKIEPLDEQDGKPLRTVNNDIYTTRDVEELSPEASRRKDAKPEKVTLYSSQYLDRNDTINEIGDNETVSSIDDGYDDDFDLKEETEKPREGGLIYFLELIGSFIQLAWGALSAIFSPSSGSGSRNS